MKLIFEGDPEEIQTFLKKSPLAGEDAREGIDNTRGIKWSKEEDASIEHAKTWYEAVTLYRIAFPESKRNRNAIRKHFWEMGEKKKKKAAAITIDISAGGLSPDRLPESTTDPVLGACAACDNGTGGKKFDVDECDRCTGTTAPVKKKLKSAKTVPTEKKGNPAKNFEADPWEDEERDIVRKANSREDAIATYREKFPESIRSDDAIGRQFHELRPDKRDPKAVWTDEENQPILDAENVEEAIAKYQERFPESTRTIAAIKRQWYELRPEKRGEVPCGREKGSTNKAPLAGTAREKYKIPFSTKQDQKGYNHAVYICKKYDKPYAEAVKLEEADLKIKKQKMTVEVVEVKEKHPKKVKVRDEVKTPTPPVPKSRTREKRPDPVVESPSGFRVGQDVIHNGSNSSPVFGKVGKIVQIMKNGGSEQLMIRFGAATAIVLSPQFVTPVSKKGATPTAVTAGEAA